MQIKRTFKYRLYPNKQQQQEINNQLELCRILYNELLNVKKETYKQSGQSLTKYDLNDCISFFNDNNPNLKQVHSQVKQNISNRVDKAVNTMFTRIRRGENNVGMPRFKSEGRYKSLCYTQSGFELISYKTLKISKIGDINIKLHRPSMGDIKTFTLTKTTTNKYYATFSCIIDIEPNKKHDNKSIGIDVGLNHFLTTSDGQKIDNPKLFRKSESKLSKLQRWQSRKKLKSNNRCKSRLKVARLHEKVKNQRTDFLHKLSYQLTEKYSLICVENLNIKDMLKNKHLSKSISDVGWGTFINQLQYKAENAGGVVKEADRFFPSTKLCNQCGNKQDMPLHKRIYKCNVCGYIEDRDINAAKNIRDNLLSNTVGMTEINACGNDRLLSSMKQETTIFK